MREGTIAIVVMFPRPWPLLDTRELFSKADEDGSVNLLADTSGRIVLAIEPTGEDSQSLAFKPIKIEGSGRAILICRWSEGHADLALNGEDVGIAGDDPQETFVLKTADDPLPEPFTLGDLDLDSTSTEAEQLFLETLMDIEGKVSEGTRYSLIRAAGLLRQLLLDLTPLLHEVNRAHRIKIEFEVIDYRDAPPLSPDIHWRNPDPSLFPGADTVTVNLERLLRVPILSVGGGIASVRDLISASANVKGGVHLGQTRSSQQDLVIDWDSAMSVLGEEPSLAAISGICTVVLRGIQPLAQQVTGST